MMLTVEFCWMKVTQSHAIACACTYMSKVQVIGGTLWEEVGIASCCSAKAYDGHLQDQDRPGQDVVAAQLCTRDVLYLTCEAT
jgi:hypothetical protein